MSSNLISLGSSPSRSAEVFPKNLPGWCSGSTRKKRNLRRFQTATNTPYQGREDSSILSPGAKFTQEGQVDPMSLISSFERGAIPRPASISGL